jgi:tungstate transport system ATP-binding protein
MMLYTLANIRQRYHQRVVLDIDRLEIPAGGIHALLGSNGAGKSTLLRLLAFLETPVSGTLLFRGEQVEFSSTQLLKLRRRVVLVDQHPIMFSTSVGGNIEFGLKIRGMGSAQRRRVVDESLALVGLSHYREARGHELSGGETQRLALARALALSPEVLLCDEPTASVDAENQGIIADLLQQISAEQGITIIFTSHDRLQAVSLAEQTLTMEGGRLANASHDNTYTAILRRGSTGLPVCILQNRVEIPLPDWPQDRQPDQTLRVQIDPRTITLHRTDNKKPVGEEPVGTVLLIMAEGPNIRVLVNIGVLVTVIMDQAAYRRECPQIGDTVRLTLGTIRFL